MKKQLSKRLTSILLTIAMMVSLFSGMTGLASADINVSYSSYYKDINGNITNYVDFWTAWNRVIREGGTFGIYKSWRTDTRRYVGKGKTVTVELNGYVLSRDKGEKGWSNDGEVFYVDEGATLIVYGGTKETPALNSDIIHIEKVFDTDRNENFTYRSKTFYGGMIYGGNSSNGGGGIHMKEKSKVFLYYTTLAGCRAEQTWGSDGYGGGVYMGGVNCELNLDHSSICYNYAYNDGGGVYVNNKRNSILMTASHIDHNISDDNGAGIYVDAENFRLVGDAKQVMNPEAITDWHDASVGSTVSDNYIVDSDYKAGGGGGIYLWEDDAIVSGITFYNNDADDDGDGGAIFIREENVTVNNCNIIKNRADVLGGGIKNYNDNNTVKNCTIYGNTARDTGGAGGGIYTTCYNDINVTGSTIIKGNTSASYTEDNLYLAGYATSATTAYILPALTAGAEVHIRTSSSHMNRVSNVGTFDEKQFYYDNNSDHYIRWNRKDRYLEVAEGTRPVETVQVFEPDEGSRTQNVEGGYTVGDVTYPLVRGVSSYPSNIDVTKDIDSVFYYSDGYFFGDTGEFNYHLATISMNLAGAAGYSNAYGVGEDEYYLDKSKNFRQFVSDIGCKDEDIYVNDFNIVQPTSESIGVGIASKDLPGGQTLVIIGVRGMGYEAEWISNMTLGTAGEAYGFSSAASQVYAELNSYLESKDIDGYSENTKFWFTGFSRAGATANLTAKRVVDEYNNDGSRVYAYCMEPPKGGRPEYIVEGNNYNCIHNIVNQNDIVPWVAPSQMGFIRYGVDHYVPGAATTDGANSAWNVSKDSNSDYVKQRDKMLAQLDALDGGVVFDDYFHAATVNYIIGDMIDEASFDEGETPEKFIPFFFEKFQEYGLYYAVNNDYRQAYAGAVLANGKTFEQAMATVAGIVMGKSVEETEGLGEVFGSIMDRISFGDKVTLYEAIRSKTIDYVQWISAAYALNPGSAALTIENIVHLIKGDSYWQATKEALWKLITQTSEDEQAQGYHVIQDYLKDSEFKALENSFDALMIPLIGLITSDYAEYSQKTLGTMAYNAPRLLSNHYQEVVHAWLRSYDSFYEQETDPVSVSSSASRTPSGTAVKIVASDGSETTYTEFSQDIPVNLGDRIYLVPASADEIDTGAAFYYSFTSAPESNRGLKVFSDPWNLYDLVDVYSETNRFVADVTMAHYGIKLPAQTVSFVLTDYAVFAVPQYLVGFNNKWSLGYKIHNLQPGESVAVEGRGLSETNNNIFVRWRVYPVEGDHVSNIPIGIYECTSLFGDDFDVFAESTVATNVAGGSYRFVPEYKVQIDSITIDFEGANYAHLGTIDVYTDDVVLGEDVISTWTREEGDFDGYEYQYTGKCAVGHPEGYEYADHITSYDFRNAADVYNVSSEVIDDVLYITFNVRGQEGFCPELTDPSTLDVNIYDLNTGEYVDTVTYFRTYMKFYDGEEVGKDITVSAPMLPDYEFAYWGDDANIIEGTKEDSTVVISRDYDAHNECTVYVKPVVKKLTVTLDSAVVGGQALPGLESVTATISNEWEINNVDLAWFENDSVAKYETVYVGWFTVNKAKMTGRNLDDPEGETVDLSGEIVYSDKREVEVYTKDGEKLNTIATVVSEDSETLYLYVLFEKTGKMKITHTAAIYENVPHGSTESDVLNVLPETVYAYVEDGSLVPVSAEWTRVVKVDDKTGEETDEPIDFDILGAQTVRAYGNLITDKYDANGVEVTALITILPADKVQAPTANPPSGKYTGSVTVELSSEEDAVIHYAVVELDKGEQFTPDYVKESDYSIYSEPIKISNYEKAVYIFTYATKEGYNNSSVNVYGYELTKPEVKKLEAKPAKIAENGNVECYYSVKTVYYEDTATGEKVTEEIPDRYYSDESCLHELDYNTEVVVPAFIKATYAADAGSDPNTETMGYTEAVTYGALDTIGVRQAYPDDTDADTVHVCTVVDSRILRDATDYGYILSTSSADTELTVDTANYKRSCAGTDNGLGYEYGNTDFASTNYKYVTALVQGCADAETPVRARFYVRLENGTDYIYGEEVECVPSLDYDGTQADFTDNTEFKVNQDKLFVGHSITLDGSIGLNFFLDVKEEEVAENATVTFTWFNKKIENVPLVLDPNGSGYYKVTCPLAAAEMTYGVTAVMNYNGEPWMGEIDTYSVKRYADEILDEDGSFRPNYIAAENAAGRNGAQRYAFLSTLVKSMLDYGSMLQIKFDRNTDVPANDGTMYYPGEAYIETANSDMTEGLEEYGLAYVSTSVVYLDATSLRHYYRIVDQDKFDAVKDSITFDGETVTAVSKGDKIYFEKRNISAAELDREIGLIIGYRTYLCSVLDYSAAASATDSAPYEESVKKQLAAAVYRYNVAAKYYIQ